jgi:hypothetical protein
VRQCSDVVRESKLPFLLAAPCFLVACTSEIEVKHPVSMQEADRAAHRFAAGATKVPVHDELGHTHEVGPDQLFYEWDDGRGLGVTYCHRSWSTPGFPDPPVCLQPPPPRRAELTTGRIVPNWPGIIVGGIAVGALAGSIGCFTSWCDSTGRTVVGVTDGVVLGVVLVGGFLLFVDVVKAATRD